MRFMIIVKATQASEAGVMPPEWLFERMGKYHEELARAGMLLDASGLKASQHGWRVRYQGDKVSVVDGPFTESKELVAGYTLIQAKSREEALEWTRRFPNPSHDNKQAEIEVRQLFVWDDFEKSQAIEQMRELDAGRSNKN
jgi:hypothetical protein